MDLKRKILRLEGVLIGRAGLPQWAIKVAEESIRIRQLFRPNMEEIEKALLREDPTYQPKPKEPHPISDSMNVDEFASALVARFKTKQDYKEWQRQRYAEGCAKMMETIGRLKREQGDAA